MRIWCKVGKVMKILTIAKDGLGYETGFLRPGVKEKRQ